jgi:hypothetical protein
MVKQTEGTICILKIPGGEGGGYGKTPQMSLISTY